MIKVENLSKWYGTIPALDSVGFTLSAPSITGLVGQNGAGKSTMLNILTGYLSPSSGDISIMGMDLRLDPIKIRNHLGYLPEKPPLYPYMTMDEFLFFVAELKGIGRGGKKKAVNGVKELAGISQFGKRLIGNLSKGYRQRLGIAQALLGDPEIIILDEPLSGLDPKQIIETRELIQQLGKVKLVLFSSHLLHDIRILCDHVIFIHEGKVVLDSPVDTITDFLGDRKGVFVQFQEDEKRVEAIIEESPYKNSFHWTQGYWKGEVCCHIETDSTDGVNEVAKLLIDHGIKIKMIRSAEPNMEEFFLQLPFHKEGIH